MTVSENVNLGNENVMITPHPIESEVVKYVTKKLQAVNKFESLSKSVNYVFPLHEEGKVVAFLKISRSDKNGAIIEHFVWEMARIFDCEELFVPTGLIEVAKRVDQVFVANKKVIERKVIVASVQFKQEGLPAHLFKGKLDKRQVIEASLIALLFGVYDWHNANVMIDKDKRLKFFDNARAFPNSNEIHESNLCFTSPFRFGLLRFESCHQELTKNDFEIIDQKIKLFRSKMPEFIGYLKEAVWKEKNKCLPLGWFEVESVIKSTQSRLNHIENIVKDRTLKTIVEMICKIYPNYTFFVILALVKISYLHKNFKFSEKKLRKAFEEAGAMELRSSMILLCELGVNTEDVYEKCMQSKLSMTEIAKGVLSLIIRKNILARERRGIEAAREAGLSLFHKLISRAVFEPRDCLLVDSGKEFQDYFLEELSKLEVPVLMDENKLNPKWKKWVAVNSLEGSGSYTLCQQGSSVPLDVTSFPSYIRVGNGKLMTIKEFAKIKL